MRNISSLPCGDIGGRFRSAIQRNSVWIWVAVAGYAAASVLIPSLDSLALLFVATGALVPLLIWLNAREVSLPIMVLIAIQTGLVYGIPLVTKNESLIGYPPAAIRSAAMEVMIFGMVMAAAWQFGIKHPAPKRPSFLIFRFLTEKSGGRLNEVSLYLIGANLLFKIAESTGLIGALTAGLPAGVFPIIRTLAQAAGMGGALLGAFCVGSSAAQPNQKAVFWVIFWLLFLMEIMSYLLSSATGLMCAVSLGLMIGKGRPPVAFLVTLGVVCSFFNMTKFEMRNKYWDPSLGYAQQSLVEIPERLMEWTDRSYTALLTPEIHKKRRTAEEQKLYDRVNNMVNLLWVQQAVNQNQIPLLAGETYIAIPSLLIPRIFWPEKPIAHVGQVMLNVHFKRQTAEQTKRTFVAWGLLAEAYGNFGPYIGATILGAFLGYSMGRVEAWIKNFPIGSLQAFIVLAFTVKIGTSFEMVASVFVTSTFQLLVAIFGASYILVERKKTSLPVGSVPPSPSKSNGPPTHKESGE